eukprot:464804_1
MMSQMFRAIRTKLKKAPSPVITPKQDDKPDVVDELSVELNAKRLNTFDFRLINECGIHLGGIYNPLIIIVSYQSAQSMISIDEHVLPCQRTTHKETKQWMTRNIQKLKHNELLAQYDGVIFVMLCIAKVKEINGVKTFQEYHDANGVIKHIDKLRKDTIYRLHDGMKLYVYWDKAVQYIGQRFVPKHYNTMQVEQIKDLLQHMQQARYIIDGYCRRHNKIVLQELDILRQILFYYQTVMDDDDIYIHSVAQYGAALKTTAKSKLEDAEPWELIHEPINIITPNPHHQLLMFLKIEAMPVSVCNGACGSMVSPLIDYCLNGSIYQMSVYPTAMQQLLSNDVSRRGLNTAIETAQYDTILDDDDDDLSNISTEHLEQIVDVLHQFQEDNHLHLLRYIANKSCLIPRRVLIVEILQNEDSAVNYVGHGSGSNHNNKKHRSSPYSRSDNSSQSHRHEANNEQKEDKPNKNRRPSKSNGNDDDDPNDNKKSQNNEHLSRRELYFAKRLLVLKESEEYNTMVEKGYALLDNELLALIYYCDDDASCFSMKQYHRALEKDCKWGNLYYHVTNAVDKLHRMRALEMKHRRQSSQHDLG